MKTIIHHLIEQTLRPDQDKDQFLAYLILNEIYPSLTYLSYDGFYCHGLADYSKNLVWQDKKIIDHSTKEIILNTETYFTKCTTNDICNIWIKVNGDTVDGVISSLYRDQPSS